jgi:hypothetical protein
MTRFKLTNVYVEYDDDYNKVEDPITKQLVDKGNPATLASKWERDVLGILDGLYLHSQVGRMLFDACQMAGSNRKTGQEERKLVISPYTYKDEKKMGVCNAYEQGNPTGWDVFVERITRDTAGGYSVIVHYDKQRWTSGGPCGPAPGRAGAAADEALLHEMLHGLRDLAGQDDNAQKLAGGWDTLEEFYAILITNIYMSERGRMQLRKDHHGYQPLEKNLSTSTGFLTKLEHLRWLSWLVNRNAVFLRRVADVVTSFNPIRAYLGDPQFYNDRLKAGAGRR